MDTPVLFRTYLEELQTLLRELDLDTLARMTDVLLEAWRNGRRILFMGNGGSHGSVSHIVNDFQKNVMLESGRAPRTLCLSDCTPLIMAWANDTEWANIFAPQIECWAEPGDVVIGVSGSGNSQNVIRGIEVANRLGATTLGLAGFGGGKLKATAQHCLVVDCHNMQRVEDVHMVALHLLFTGVMEQAKQERTASEAHPA